MICWKCKKEIKIESIHRNSECPECHADLHCCRGCKFYAPGSHYDCKETVDELVTDKDRSNFCDWFSTAAISEGSGGGGTDKAKAARDAFNALFG